MIRPALHFVGFRGDEYNRARGIFGKPDFIHPGWDMRAQREIADVDTVVFAKGTDADAPNPRNYSDLREP